MFVHDAVLEAVICGDTEITTDKYEMKLMEMKKVNPGEPKSVLQSQFDLLHQVTPHPDDVLCDSAKRYAKRNRSNNYLPREYIMQEFHNYVL